ncbi:ABC-2 type transport system ATP-binding protein [Kineothrix alysoides]|uniref:ABC-2 type transport system ATP-binding protein n=1 Tax=Kineothrix alysoides TaxID=1469948 RepID=A0A4R1R4N2_9FIRM|nr:ABC transporter ATP-binding protein [Kineothrix alysoides]TCL60443.1 ABC-2 type transport system ATP-binding protein [Kineothrix alysoides]
MNALEITNLTKEYKDFKLDNVSLRLPSGCIMGLIGENGAGKSTMIKLIMNAINRDGGEITVLGKDNRADFKVTKEDIGIVLDETGFPEIITAKQLNAIMKMTYQNWEEETYFHYIERFSLPGKKPFKDYSRGMKMKLAIAAAMSHRAKLLVLDEATSGLDPIVRDEILDIFLEFTRKEENSILISSHIVSDLEKLCDYIAFLHKGKLIFCEEKDRLLENYAILHCKKTELNGLEWSAIKGKRENSYGVDALVDRKKVPRGMNIENASIEDIILFMVKGVDK